LKITWTNVCAQIRIGDNLITPFMKREETKKLCNFIQNQFINKNKEYKLFITSDHSDVIDEAFRVFNNEFSFVFWFGFDINTPINP
jgi:hypothetical protein